jgi:hypothetical protein
MGAVALKLYISGRSYSILKFGFFLEILDLGQIPVWGRISEPGSRGDRPPGGLN